MFTKKLLLKLAKHSYRSKLNNYNIIQKKVLNIIPQQYFGFYGNLSY